MEKALSPIQVKVVLLGSHGTGKTTFAKMFIGDKGVRDESQRATIGADIFARRVTYDINPFGKVEIIWSIFELAGAYHFREIHEDYYKDAKAAIIMFDLCRRESFEDVPLWVSDFIKNVGKDKPIILVGNKADLRGMTRCMSSSQPLSYVEKLKETIDGPVLYMEVSAINGYNIEEVFEKLAALIAENVLRGRKQ